MSDGRRADLFALFVLAAALCMVAATLLVALALGVLVADWFGLLVGAALACAFAAAFLRLARYYGD